METAFETASLSWRCSKDGLRFVRLGHWGILHVRLTLWDSPARSRYLCWEVAPPDRRRVRARERGTSGVERLTVVVELERRANRSSARSWAPPPDGTGLSGWRHSSLSFTLLLLCACC